MNAPAQLAVAAAARTTEAPATQSELDRLLARPFTPRDLLEDTNFDKIWRMAEALANSALSIPKELKGNVGDCMAIVTQAMIWGLNPFAVAQKAHVINGRLGYEAQLVNAVVMQSGAIRGSFSYEYRGDGQNLECRVGAVLRGESEVRWGEWLSSALITTKNSPLWKVNPRQQLGYLQVKNWARAFAPGAILGIYSSDELADFAGDFAPASAQATAAAAAPTPPAQPGLPPCSDEALSVDMPMFQRLIESGKKTPAQILTMLGTKYTLTELQKARVLSLKRAPEAPAPAAAPAADGADEHSDFVAAMDAAEAGDA